MRRSSNTPPKAPLNASLNLHSRNAQGKSARSHRSDRSTGSKSKASTGTPQSTKRRCAIYTRKSSEEGLEQAFNSLDAQREACEAFVRSQRHEGWVLLPTAYDDGGISGGTLERPALQQLLADISIGKVDLVIVYKVDRLTRSLADFAKIVEVFDAQGASFVSVTQQFNTATSMGRLTLNMLLSFAQFEREVTGERIRDKIAASKRKGMWMGGNVPLGYDVQERKLVINPAEAATVIQIFQLYLALGSVRQLQEQLAIAGVRSKARPLAESPKMRGGQVLARGALYAMLQNRLYRGEVVHQGNVYPGEHAAIIELDLWDVVQRRLTDNRVEQHSGTRAANPSLLTGLIYDGAGERLLPTHSQKGERRYRYYVSKALQTGTPQTGAQQMGDDESSACTAAIAFTASAAGTTAVAAMRIPAGDLERAVTDRLTHFLADRSAIYNMVSSAESDGAAQAALIARAATLATEWPEQPLTERRALLRRLISRITVHPKRIDITVDTHALIGILRNGHVGHLSSTADSHDGDAGSSTGAATEGTEGTTENTKDQDATIEIAAVPPAASLQLTIPVHLKRAGMEMRMLVEGAAGAAEPDPTLIKLILRAQQLRDRMMTERLGVSELAASEGITGSYVTRIIRLGFLAPDIVTAILNGRQPVGLTANKLANDSRLPNNWAEQRQALGFR